MEDAPGTPGRRARRIPGAAEILDPLPVAVKHERHDAARFPQFVVLGLNPRGVSVVASPRR